MMKFKKWLSMLLAVLMVVSLAACANTPNAADADDTTDETTSDAVVSAEPILNDKGEEVGGYKIGFFYLPESDGLSAQFHRALDYCAALTNCEIEYYDMMTFTADEISTAVETLVSVGCDGVMMISGTSPALFEYMNEQGVYYVGLTRSYNEEVANVVDGSEYNCGWLNEAGGVNFQMGYDLTEVLANKGCKNIAYLAQAPGSEIGDDRVRGIEAACEDFGINIVTSYRGADYAAGASDILATRGAELDGFVSNSNGDIGIAAINMAGYTDSIQYAQVDAPSASDTENYFEMGNLAATTSGNNVYVVQMFMQLFNAISGADRLFNEGDRIIPMIPSFVVTDAQGWRDSNQYIGGDIPGLVPDEVLSLNSWYDPDTTVEEKEALMESYTDSEYWNLDSIVARVKAYLGES